MGNSLSSFIMSCPAVSFQDDDMTIKTKEGLFNGYDLLYGSWIFRSQIQAFNFSEKKTPD